MKGNKSRVIEDHEQDPELCEFSNDSDSNDDMDTPRDDDLNSPNDQSKPYHMMDSKEKRRERNKILARKSRLKTKNELETLKVQLVALMKENEALKRTMNTIIVPPASAQDLLNADFQLPDTIATLVKQLIAKEDKGITPRKLRRTSFCISNAISTDFPIVYASPGFVKLTGYELSEIIGRNCRMLHGPKTDREEVTKMRDCLQKGEDFNGVVLNYRKDGKAFWNQVRLVHLKDQNNRTFLVVGIQIKVKPNLESGTLMSSGFQQRRKGMASSTTSSSTVTSSVFHTNRVLETVFPSISHQDINAFCHSVLSKERHQQPATTTGGGGVHRPSIEDKGSSSQMSLMDMDDFRREEDEGNLSDGSDNIMQDMSEETGISVPANTNNSGSSGGDILDDLFPSTNEMDSFMSELKNTTITNNNHSSMR